jgi:hypothetical protein
MVPPRPESRRRIVEALSASGLAQASAAGAR